MSPSEKAQTPKRNGVPKRNAAPKRSGRRRGEPDTRGTILAAARELFARDGLDNTSIRAIAGKAGVDPSLVHHYFGTKRELFLESVAIPIDPAELLSPLKLVPVGKLGAAMVKTLVTVWDSDFGTAGVALVKSNIAGPDPSMLRTIVGDVIFAQIAPRIDKPLGSARIRTSLIASQLIGLIMMRYVVKLEPIASMRPTDVVSLIGPTVQRYMTGDLPDGVVARSVGSE